MVLAQPFRGFARRVGIGTELAPHRNKNAPAPLLRSPPSPTRRPKPKRSALPLVTIRSRLRPLWRQRCFQHPRTPPRSWRSPMRRPGRRSLMANEATSSFTSKRSARLPLLTIEEEITLARRIRKGNKAARAPHDLGQPPTSPVKIAMDYKDFGLPLLDLISEGNIGRDQSRGTLQIPARVENFRPTPLGGSSSPSSALSPTSPRLSACPCILCDKISKMRKMAMKLSEQLGSESRPTRSWQSSCRSRPPRSPISSRLACVRPC